MHLFNKCSFLSVSHSRTCYWVVVILELTTVWLSFSNLLLTVFTSQFIHQSINKMTTLVAQQWMANPLLAFRGLPGIYLKEEFLLPKIIKISIKIRHIADCLTMSKWSKFGVSPSCGSYENCHLYSRIKPLIWPGLS